MACRNRAPVRSKACFMDDLLREFLTETSESLDTVDNQLVKFEQVLERGMAAMSEPVEPAIAAKPAVAQGTLVPQTLERALRPGEVSLDDLERALRETAIEAARAPTPKQPAVPSPSPSPA